MGRREPKKDVVVAEAGHGPALRHNPFGALSDVPGPPAPSAAESADPSQPDRAPEKKKPRGRLVLRRETKHRGGKAVVVVSGLRADAHLAESEIAALLKVLKQQLACGGTVERVRNDTEIVLQGDTPGRVAELLRAKGFRVDGVTA